MDKVVCSHLRASHPLTHAVISLALILCTITNAQPVFSQSIYAQASDSQTQKSADNTIHIEITTHMGDAQTFVEGDTLSFFINLDRDANVLVLYEDASGTLVQILPNAFSPQTLYHAGFFIQVPSGMLRHHFIVAPPFGRERILAFASEKTLPQLPGQQLQNGLKHIAMETSAAMILLHNFAVKTQEYYGEASLEITTVARQNAQAQ